MSSKNMNFIYINSKGEISARSLSSVSVNGDYIQGFCHSSNALRTFRKDRVLKQYIDRSEENTLLQNYQENAEKYRSELNLKPLTKVNHRSSNGEIEICFTGYKSKLKSELIELAENHYMIVRTSVTRNLFFLCCGANAGPAKVDKARDQGCLAISEGQFRHFIETGEIMNHIESAWKYQPGNSES